MLQPRTWSFLQEARFNIVCSLAPYKVVIFNRCNQKEFAVESFQICKHLRLTLQVAGIDTIYEQSESNDESAFEIRWDWFQRLGTPLAVVVDNRTITDSKMLLTIIHADSGRRVNSIFLF